MGGTGPGPVVAGTSVVVVAAALLAIAVILIKIIRQRSESRSTAAALPYRRDLVAIAAGEDPGRAAYARLQALPAAEWDRIASTVVAMIAKLRAEPAEELILLVRHHGEVDSAHRDLTSRSPVRRARAAHVLGLVGDSDEVSRLTPLLYDGSAEVRLVAARSLGSIGDPRAAAVVLDSVRARHHRAGVPVHIVAQALTQMGLGVAPVLNIRLGDSDPSVRQTAAMVAGGGTFSSTSTVLGSLVAEDPHTDVRICAARALGQVGTSIHAAILIGQLESSQPAEVRRACAAALGELACTEAVEPLGALLSDPDRRLATLAADSLVAIGNRGTARLRAEGTLTGALVAGGALATADLAATTARGRSAR